MNTYLFLNFLSTILDVSNFLLHLFYTGLVQFLGTQISSLPLLYVLCITWGLTLAGCYICLGPANGRHLQGKQRKGRNQGVPSTPFCLGWFLVAVASPARLQSTPKNSTVVFVSTRCPQKSHHLSLWGFSPLQICRLSHHPDLFASQQSHHRVTNSLY